MDKFYIAFTYKFYTAFTYRHGERLTIPLLYVVRRLLTFWTGTDRHGSWLTAEQTGTGDILEWGLTLLLLSVLLSHTLVMLQLYFLLLFDNHQLWVQLPFPQQVTSEPSHCPPLSGCPHPVETEHPVNEMMKKYLLLLSTEGKQTISSFFFTPLYYSTSRQSQVGVLVSQHFMLNR